MYMTMKGDSGDILRRSGTERPVLLTTKYRLPPPPPTHPPPANIPEYILSRPRQTRIFSCLTVRRVDLSSSKESTLPISLFPKLISQQVLRFVALLTSYSRNPRGYYAFSFHSFAKRASRNPPLPLRLHTTHIICTHIVTCFIAPQNSHISYNNISTGSFFFGFTAVACNTKKSLVSFFILYYLPLYLIYVGNFRDTFSFWLCVCLLFKSERTQTQNTVHISLNQTNSKIFQGKIRYEGTL